MSKKLTKDDRNRMITLLKAARVRIKSQQSSHICYALEDAVTNMPIYLPIKVSQAWNDVDYLKRWIHSMLGDYYSTLTSWLIGWKEIPGHKVVDNHKKLRQTRINWIDWMINELKKKEK